jgi:hypothetical protein
MNALCISDLQIPAEHRDALRFVQHVDRHFFPDGNRFVVNQGDEVDQHTLGKWPANPSGRSGGDELKEAKLRLTYWYEAFPKVFVCTSNHTYRAWKKAHLMGLPSEFMKSVNEVYEAPIGWQWREKWIHDGVTFEHGENVSGPTAAINAAIQNQMSTVIGHQHSNGGIIYRASDTGLIFGLNTGCLIDVAQYNFDYGKNIRIKPTLGMGVIKNGIPYFIPMILTLDRRWVGYI